MKTSISFPVLVTLDAGKMIHHLGYVKGHCSHTNAIGTLALIKEHIICINKKTISQHKRLHYEGRVSLLRISIIVW